jgi:hypothetical protein
MRSVCPNQLNLCCCIFSISITVCPDSFFYICVSSFRSYAYPHDFLSHPISAANIFCSSSAFIVQHSASYIKTGTTNVSYNFILVVRDILLFFHNFPSLPTTAAALLILCRISLPQFSFSMITAPRCVNSLTCSNCSLATLIVMGYEYELCVMDMKCLL